jgi:hypothetical protein
MLLAPPGEQKNIQPVKNQMFHFKSNTQSAALNNDELRNLAPSIFASQPVADVSDRYSFLPTSSILDGMRDHGWMPVRAEQQHVRTAARQGFQKHLIRFARIESLDACAKNQVRPEIVLLNSHDKSSAYQLHCGLLRTVCLNGMVVADATFQRISIKHVGFSPDSVIEASFKVLDAVPGIMEKVKLFQDRILTDAERLALATGAAVHRWEDLGKAPVSPLLLLNPRRYGDGAKDLWTTLNAVQENITKGGQKDYSRRRPDGDRMPKSRAVKGIDEDLRLNKALWHMAEVLRNNGGLQA